MDNVPKILAIPPHKWYMEAHAEYLTRYLSDEFFMEIGNNPYPPYETYLERFPNESPFHRNPNEYDLIWPIWPGHWGVDQEEFKHKTALVFYEPGEGRTDIAVLATTTDKAHESVKDIPHHRLRFGIDTNLFKPIPMVREDNLLHVGMVGTLYNPRRMVKELVPVLKQIEGVRLMLFLNMAPRNEKELDDVGGDLSVIVSGDKWWPGMPNVYNRLDVLIRCDQDAGYSFPVVEAAACGVPVVATDCGIDHIFTEAGAGILIPGTRADHMGNPDNTVALVVKAVETLRDDPERRKRMGEAGRKEVEENWTWEKNIGSWREFFKEGVSHARSGKKLDQ